MSSVQEAAADGQQREESRAADMWGNSEHTLIDESWLQWVQQLWCFRSSAGGGGSDSKGCRIGACSSAKKEGLSAAIGVRRQHAVNRGSSPGGNCR